MKPRQISLLCGIGPSQHFEMSGSELGAYELFLSWFIWPREHLCGRLILADILDW